MKKNNILFLSLISGLLCFSAACSDEDDSSLLPPPVDIEGTEGTDNSSITKLAWKETEKTVTFLNESKDIPVNLQLSKAGSSNKEAVNAQLTPLTQEELDAYNAEHKTSYALLPAEYYSLPATIEVAADVKQQKVDMTIKSTVKDLTDINDRQYAVAVRLTAEGCEIKEGYDFLLIQLKAITPKFSLVEPSGVIGEGDALIAGITEDITKTLNVAMNVDNRWNSRVVFETDPAKLQGLVDVYNQTESKSATLLPADYYTIGTDGKLEFSATDESNKEVAIVISAKASSTTALSEGEYILPVTMAACEGMPFLINKETVCYFKFSVETPILSIGLASGETNSDIVEASKSTTKKLSLKLNTGFQWDEAATVSFETEQSTLEGLVSAYNTENSTNYTLLPSDTYTLNEVELTRELTNASSKDYPITITTTAQTATGEYLLPVQMKSCTNNAIAVEESIIYLQISVMKKLDLTNKLSTNSEGISSWAYVPITKLTDNNYYCSDANDGYPYYPNNPGSSNKNNAGYWQSEWTFDANQYSTNKDVSKNYDVTYGVYIDIDIQSFSLTGAAKFLMWASRGNYPKKIIYYTAENSNSETWTKVKEITDASFEQTTVDGLVNGEQKTNISIKKYESDYISINPSTRKIRISILTNASDKAMNTGTHQGEVSLDELELYGY